jgi:predicted RNA-binding protein with PUA-like domain
MRYWLLKSEPGTYAWADLVRDGSTAWDGVRNNQAALNLKAMAAGDLALIYHSGDERAAVGIAEVTRTAYPDPGDEAGRFVAVDVRPVEPLARAVSLKEMKADKSLTGMELFRLSRLSVVEVQPSEWSRILELARG